MKKLFVFLALAAVVFTACNKPATSGKDKGGKTGGYEAPIKIDGDFSDWAALDPSKVVVAECGADAAYKDLKKMKLYYDEYYLFVYLEYDFSAYGNKVGSEDGAWFVTHMFCFNDDNNTATGGYPGQWEQGDKPCIDGFVEFTTVDGDPGETPDQRVIGSLVHEPTFAYYEWTGAPNASTWSWGAVEADMAKFAKGYATDRAIEISFLRALYPRGKMEDTITIGVNCQVNGWDATGALPNQGGEVSDTNPTGRPNLLSITAIK